MSSVKERADALLIETAALIRMAAKMGKEPNALAAELEHCRRMVRLFDLHIELEHSERIRAAKAA